MAKEELAQAVRRHEWSGRLQAGLDRAAVVLAALRESNPVRVVVFSLTILATAVFGLLVALAIAPAENPDAPVFPRAGQPIRIATLPGPGGASTVAMVQTPNGMMRLLPARVVRTVTVSRPVEPQTELRPVTDTEVVTRVEPVTVVVTNREEVTVTETVVPEVTATAPRPTNTKP